jgi:TatD DNase family protein
VIDTHCHLTFPEYEGRVDAVLAAAREAGVVGAITISTTTANAVLSVELARAHAGLWASAGVHPLYADSPADWEEMRAAALDPKCVAWGELGLDRHYQDPPQSLQRPLLEEQLAHIVRWRSEDPRLDKPVVLHCREAFDELVPVLRASGLPPERFVFHCFTGGEREMRLLLDFGAFVSFTGVVTFRNARETQAARAGDDRDRRPLHDPRAAPRAEAERAALRALGRRRPRRAVGQGARRSPRTNHGDLRRLLRPRPDISRSSIVVRRHHMTRSTPALHASRRPLPITAPLAARCVDAVVRSTYDGRLDFVTFGTKSGSLVFGRPLRPPPSITRLAINRSRPEFST